MATVRDFDTADALAEARQKIRRNLRRDEVEATADLLSPPPLKTEDRQVVAQRANLIVTESRRMKQEQGPLEAFMQEFGLSNQEGIALMCLAEALLRVPDADTQDMLIAEKIGSGKWAEHLGHSDSTFVNASIWALTLTGRVIGLDRKVTDDPVNWAKSLVSRLGEPVIRRAVNEAMRILGKQFVFGRTMPEALDRMKKLPKEKQLFSFDMLGEGARTQAAADRYIRLYGESIEEVGAKAPQWGEEPHRKSSVSIKLSALHPRYEFAQAERVMNELLPKAKELALKAKKGNMQLTLDSEEADRLDISLDVFEALATDPDLAGWNGLGIAVQGYQKRAPAVIEWLRELARLSSRRISVRLVKGAYWDTELKHAQEAGLSDYPVWTQKIATDVCYLTCARLMLEAQDEIYPQFATHNAHTIAAIEHMATGTDYEFQRLHGMGDLLYKAAAMVCPGAMRVRTYAPVGTHKDLLPYLVRRLLENGANSSFVNQFLNERVSVDQVTADPILTLELSDHRRHPGIPTPDAIYGEARRNSRGVDLFDPLTWNPLKARLDELAGRTIKAASLVNGKDGKGKKLEIVSPTDTKMTVGQVTEATAEEREKALSLAKDAQKAWDRVGGAQRAKVLRRMGDLMEQHFEEAFDLLIREAGKTLSDCDAEVREAVDFCRFYANLAEEQFGAPRQLPGPTGEDNRLGLCGRGVFLCISPWNFPLAIFCGQVAAALAAGNAVIAKPAEQTPLIAHWCVRLFHEAGVPTEVLHLLCGDGPTVAAPLVEDERISGVAFTGSTQTAKIINRSLAAREGAIVPLIAETGGLNAMVVDSTALPEQVTDCVVQSAFHSAGQRCSALRVLLVQEDVADIMIDMVAGALREQRLGYPGHLSSDIGPIIDEDALAILRDHSADMEKRARLVETAKMSPDLDKGSYFAPRIFELQKIEDLEKEVFGPILHVVRYKAKDLPRLMDYLENTGYGLTFGIQSRLEKRWDDLVARSAAGNIYVNRNMTGAVVGVQPFGGKGLSGTGPKAGGPHYLLRFANERVVTNNTAAIGGNAELFQL